MYADSKMKDPLQGVYQVLPWCAPTSDQASLINKELKKFCDVRGLAFMWQCLVVDLQEGGRVYRGESLPSVTGGWKVTYREKTRDKWVMSYWIPPSDS